MWAWPDLGDAGTQPSVSLRASSSDPSSISNHGFRSCFKTLVSFNSSLRNPSLVQNVLEANAQVTHHTHTSPHRDSGVAEHNIGQQCYRVCVTRASPLLISPPPDYSNICLCHRAGPIYKSAYQEPSNINEHAGDICLLGSRRD